MVFLPSFCPVDSILEPVCLCEMLISKIYGQSNSICAWLGKERFLLGWGGGVVDERGGVISNYDTNWGGSNLFYTQPGEGYGWLTLIY